MTEEERVAWCRKEGLFTHHLALKRELDRKEKALAETAALLVLKKSRLYLGEPKDD